MRSAGSGSTAARGTPTCSWWSGPGRGAACAEPGLEQALHQRAVHMEAMPTAEAVRRINELLDLGDADWTAALHLTC